MKKIILAAAAFASLAAVSAAMPASADVRHSPVAITVRYDRDDYRSHDYRRDYDRRDAYRHGGHSRYDRRHDHRSEHRYGR